MRERTVTTDDTVRTAVARLQPRSDRTIDPDQLVATFVDNGIVRLLDVKRNQVIYGRRGTGKTHVLGILDSIASAREKTAVAYIDIRTLGSSTLFTDPERPIHERFIGLYKDFLTSLYNVLFEYAMEKPSGNVDAALEDLDEIERQLRYSESAGAQVRHRSATDREASGSTGVGAEIGSSGAKVSLGRNIGNKEVREDETERSYAETDKIVFPAVYDAFQSVLGHLDLTEFVVLIDEWSSIPPDLQPYLADLLNRIFFANPRVTIKIATLEGRSRFVVVDEEGQKRFGLELGGDIESFDLDDFYVYDRDPSGAEATFADVLYRHVLSALDGPLHLKENFGIDSAADFVGAFFTDNAFKELVRAAEGVARDLLQVFARSYTHSWRTGAARITGPNVTIAARDWYESDKQSNLGEEQHRLLRALTENVIAKKRARSFLVAREDSASALLRSLIDQRVVHMIRKGYADKDNPGARYNIYTLDYGCYVDLKGTKTEPQFELPLEELKREPPEDVVVPFDDHRSIRRIIVPRALLYPAST